MKDKVTRVRFAPSPTGPLHMGGVRTALYNYLYAKQQGGVFVLRIEDTDSQRFVPGAEKYIIESLKWCNILPTEGIDKEGNVVETPSAEHPFAPYRQSQRKPIYRKYAEQLIASGNAYYAFDTPEELDAKRQEAEANHSTFIYNFQNRNQLRNSLTMPADEVEKLLKTTNHWTIRFKIPEGETVAMDDLIRGHIEVETNTLDDKVLWKAVDELPTYHLANIVDDHLMEITEVIRGAEWLPSLPLHYLLYKAFGWQDSQPRFAHLSLLLKPDGKGKLSKRDGDRLGFPVFPLKWTSPTGEVSRGYREDGYYPEAFVNMLALLGWNPGTEQEIFTLDELAKVFSFDRVIKSGARFNPEKAKWFNEQYLRMRTPEQLAKEFIPILQNSEAQCPAVSDLKFITQVCGLIKERAHFVGDFSGICKCLFKAPENYEEKDVAKFCKPEIKAAMEKMLEHIKAAKVEDYPSGGKNSEDIDTYKTQCCNKIEEMLTSFINENGWKMGSIMNTIRLYLTGTSCGLGIADLIYFMGKEEAVKRIEKGITKTF
ncbi:MAG: glutamate--tRNA ligase [Bacteroidales bacterium]|jgi:glutamyl-tRNA synthetase|nr:glutamate--tRNA ligase [Bacteroidales bacterium]MCI1733789.1 glutamate--tRNA ligase [Bacteroidales bacterium]